jgi:hypothetical protein
METDLKVTLACITAIVILITVTVSYDYYATIEDKWYLIAFLNNETFNSYRDRNLTAQEKFLLVRF